MLRLLNGTLTFMLIALIAVGGTFFMARHQFDRPGPLAQSAIIVIPKGSGVNAVADRLESEGAIHDKRLFTASVLWFRLKSYFSGRPAPVIKAGEYELRRNASLRQVLDALVEGKSILMKVTIAEGLTGYQIIQLLNQHPDLTGEIAEIPAEGTLLPDTYRFSRGMDRSELIARMQKEQREFLESIWPTRATNLPVQTVEEAVTLASIVEKETGVADERERVAGVFVNRLTKGMRLQSDPTIIYGINKGQGSLGRPILRSELDAKNPYNTYQINGLPPTPISNPGRAAIEAVLNPAVTKDLYFVADGSGGHAFAESLADHQSNVKNWRKIEREARAKAQAAAAEATADGTAAAVEAPEKSAGPGVLLDDIAGVDVEGGSTDPAVDPVAAPTAEPEPGVAAEAGAADLPLPKPKPKKK